MPRALLVTLICFVAVSHGSMQTRNASDGPWSGWVRCELSAQLNEQGRSYVNQQTHTWELTASAPASGTDIKEFPATWTVAGGGTGQRLEGLSRTVADKWQTAGPAMATTISFRVDLTGGLIIALRGAQLSSVGATTGESVARGGNVRDQQTSIRPLNVDEYRFPLIRDDATKTSITGSTGPVTIGNVSPGQPPRTVSTANCSWNFVRGGQAPPPPSSGRSITRDQAAPLSPVSGLNVPGTAPTATPIPGTQPGRVDAGPPQTTTGGRTGAELTRAGTGAVSVPTPSTPTQSIPGALPGRVEAGPPPTTTGGRADASLSRTTTSGVALPPPTLPPVSVSLSDATLLADSYVRCQIDVDGGPDYNDHQTHTWTLRSGATPTSAGVYEATWNVTGQGYRAYTTPANPAAPLIPPVMHKGYWRYSIAGISAPISVVSAGAGAVVSLSHQPMTAQTGATGIETHTYTVAPALCQTGASICFRAGNDSAFSVPVPEFQPGRIDVPGTVANGITLLGVGPTSVPVSRPVLQWQPATAKATASCSWNLPPPTPATSSGLSTPPPPALPAGALPSRAAPVGTGGTADSTAIATIDPNAVICSTTFPTVTTKATPGEVTFSWPGLSGATYTVSRTDLGVVTPAPVTGSTYTHTAAIDYRLSPYRYSIKATFADNRCATTNVAVTGPKPLVPRVTATVTQSDLTGKVRLAWGVQADRPTSYLVLGPGLNSDGAEVPAVATGQSIDIDKLQAGKYEWLVTPLWKTSAGIMSDVTSAAHATATVVIVGPPKPPTPPGPAPTNVKVQSSTGFDIVQDTCAVSIAVAWSPVPGATSYTVYNENGPVGQRTTLNSFSYFYRQKDMRLSDLVGGALLSALYEIAKSNYATKPHFTRGVNIRVGASFPDRPDGVSAPVPYGFSTFPCQDGRNFPGDP